MSLLPEIYTNALEETKAFYTELLGFRVHHTLEGYYHLIRNDGRERLLLCQAESPFVDAIFHPTYSGHGMILHFSVENIDQLYAVATAFFPDSIALPVQYEDTNGRHFTVRDPNGVLIDIIEGGDL